ncbi:MAG: beta-galactosidase [Clostridia bacterium]|nr:beta-galactosidase [Clostridia bacterium]MBQ4085242.1 beta-galactosidase [Clostridia bacterium]
MSMPRAEYPRPQFVRERWMNLNGQWQFELDQGVSGVERKVYEQTSLAGEITVPFCPESRLSGVAHVDFINACWYRKEVYVPAEWLEGRLLLHFGAVDYEARIYINGKEAGRHEGGYVSFTVDITDYAQPGVNVICVYARSDVRSGKQPAGKQSTWYHSHGCSYTRTTGIWQTVWMEPVAKNYLQKIFLTPDVANQGVHVRAVLADYADGAAFKAEASYEGKPMGETETKAFGREVRAFVPLSEAHLWELGCGRLYDLRLTFGEDSVQAYFGLRSVALQGPHFVLNGKPVFQRTVLDQGFNPEGIITAPCDEHLKHDIELSMAMGFNGARLHQKIFEPRFLYWADRLGYMVWGEHANWCLKTNDGEGLLHFLPEWIEAVERDYSSPAIIGWCPFNETDMDTDPRVLSATYHATKALDPTRPCIDTSGWVHCGDTDVQDYHDYTQDVEEFTRNVAVYASGKKGELFPKHQSEYGKKFPTTLNKGQPVFVSEYGGIGWKIGHTPGDAWGYGNNPTTEEEFIARFKGLADACLDTEGIMGLCYTQLTDVEQEINGLYTYERVPKFPAEVICPILSRKAWNED